MREFAFILVVVLILLAITAVRYRKQIAGVIGFVRMIRDAADPSRRPRAINQPAAAAAPKDLVHCAACGTWVPSDRAIRFDSKTYYCSKECVKTAMAN